MDDIDAEDSELFGNIHLCSGAHHRNALAGHHTMHGRELQRGIRIQNARQLAAPDHRRDRTASRRQNGFPRHECDRTAPIVMRCADHEGTIPIGAEQLHAREETDPGIESVERRPHGRGKAGEAVPPRHECHCPAAFRMSVGFRNSGRSSTDDEAVHVQAFAGDSRCGEGCVGRTGDAGEICHGPLGEAVGKAAFRHPCAMLEPAIDEFRRQCLGKAQEIEARRRPGVLHFDDKACLDGHLIDTYVRAAIDTGKHAGRIGTAVTKGAMDLPRPCKRGDARAPKGCRNAVAGTAGNGPAVPEKGNIGLPAVLLHIPLLLRRSLRRR